MKKLMLVLMIGLFSVTLNSPETVAQKAPSPNFTLIGEVKIDEKEHFKCACAPKKVGKCIAARAVEFGRICKKAKGEDQDCTKNDLNCPKK